LAEQYCHLSSKKFVFAMKCSLVKFAWLEHVGVASRTCWCG